MDIERHISKRDAIKLLEIAHRCLFCKTTEQFTDVVRRVQQLMVFDCTVGGYVDIRRMLLEGKVPADQINVGYPQEYMDVYLSKSLHLKDMALQDYFNTFELLNWNEVEARCPSAEGNEVVELSLAFDIRDGFVYGTCDPDLSGATCFLIGGSRIENNRRSRAILTYIIPHLSEALKRVLPAARLRDSGPLSAMEREVLSWVKEGKSSWEISMILGKSERVVNFHVANILTKLNAANRTHAVAIALGNGIIEF